MLEIKNLHAEVNGKKILKGLNFRVRPGEIHAIMGPNGSGKSTLSNIIAGKEGYDITEGDILFEGNSILDMPVEERAREGIFLALQYPVEIPGVANTYFLRAALNAQRKHRGEEELDAVTFMKYAREKAKLVNLDPKLMNRSVNEGFSGGEKKRNEIFQMAMLAPKFAVLDETDSGLDIDALKIVADGVNGLHNEEHGFVVITHYQRLLNHIVPDKIHVLSDGQIIKTGGKELALELEDKGYEWLKH